MFYWKYSTHKSHTKPHLGHSWCISISSLVKVSLNFTDIVFDPKTVLKFVGVLSKHLWIFLKGLRQSVVISGNLW